MVIVGGGLAGQRCAETLRRCGYQAPIQLLCAERHLPYDRPPLSKGLLTGARTEPVVGFRPQAWYTDQGIETLLGARARGLDIHARTVELDDQRCVTYGELVIATGGTPRRLPGIPDADNVHQLRTLDDARRLRATLCPGTRLAILGAGFIGQEVAASARARDVQVTIIDPAPVPLVGVLGSQLGGWLADLHAHRGVTMRLSRCVASVEHNGTISALGLNDGTMIDCDAVVVAVGVHPALDWLGDVGVLSDGLPTDRGGHTDFPHVWAAGDAAQPIDPITGLHTRSEHWEAAVIQAGAVARAITGHDLPPARLPSFWSDQYGVRMQFIGNSSGAQRLRLDGDPDTRDFTATFLKDGRPVAAFLVGRPHELATVRRRLTEAHLPTSQGDEDP